MQNIVQAIFGEQTPTMRTWGVDDCYPEHFAHVVSHVDN